MSVAKFFYVLSAIAFIGVVFIVGLLAEWSFNPKLILFYPHGTTLKVINSPIKAGSYLKYDLDYCKYTSDVSTIFTTLVGKNVYTLTEVQRNIPVGCRTYIISDVYIPPFVTPGTYHLEITVQYQPNPIRTIQYFTKTTNFVVQ